MQPMTKKERVMRTMNFLETDRVPLYDIIDNDPIREYYGKSAVTAENAWDFEYAAVRNLLDMTRMLTVPNFNPRHESTEDGFVYYHDKYTSWVEKHPFDDVESLARWAEKDMERKRNWTPDQAYVAAYRDYVSKHLRGLGDDTVLVIESDVGFDFARSISGIELFSYLAADEPELVSEWLEVLNQCEIRRAKAIADPELVPVMLTYTDLAFKSGPIFSLDYYRKEFFPRLKRLNDTYHEAGVKCLFHSDGNIMPLLDDLVAAGIDGINPLEIAAGMNIRTVREKYGNKLFITGGIDVSQLLPYGTEEEVMAACRQAIDDTNGVGYFLGSSTELLPVVPYRNILAIKRVADEYRVG